MASGGMRIHSVIVLVIIITIISTNTVHGWTGVNGYAGITSVRRPAPSKSSACRLTRIRRRQDLGWCWRHPNSFAAAADDDDNDTSNDADGPGGGSANPAAGHTGTGSSNQRRPNIAVPAKTYDSTAREPIRDMIDSEAAMREFFTTREEWIPLFQAMMGTNPSCPAHSFLQQWNNNAGKDHDSNINDDDDNNKNNNNFSWTTTSIPSTTTSNTSTTPAPWCSTSSATTTTTTNNNNNNTPWRRLQAIPTHPMDRQFLDAFLTSVHQSLLAIPVTASVNGQEDENDIHFLEEGRRMLAIHRFHVIRPTPYTNNSITTNHPSSPADRLERYDHLFTTCWSELMELYHNDQPHTGSLILFPQVDYQDVRRFCDMNVQRPLEWLGLRRTFEVTSLQRDSPAIRLLYKLNDLPIVPDDPSAYSN